MKQQAVNTVRMLAAATALVAVMTCGPAAAKSNTKGAGSDSFAVAVRVDRPPRLDGTLQDSLWQLARPIVNFRQREPYEGKPATERTEVRILYTRHAVYFGINCLQPQSSIVATQLRRDVTQELDDYIEIIIDSTHDRRNAYAFQVNPLGTQMDGLITEQQSGSMYSNGDFDPGWDGVWTSAAQVTDQGWTVTVEIPFSTLNFTKARDVIWGLNIKRFVRNKNEEDLWSGWQRRFGIARISQAGELRGITDIESGRLLIVKPYALGGFQHLPSSAQGTGLPPGMNALHTGGADIKLGIRSNLVANFTANTDFADAEVDTTQFNLTPYKLFYPEKRQFFLENAGIFNFPLGAGEGGDLLFFSRQIGIDPVTGQQVPVNGGGKITGSMDGFQLGLMDVNTRQQGPNPSANYAVVRVKRALFGDSYIGAMAVQKNSGNAADAYNQNGGLDARIFPLKNLALTAFAATTRTPGLSGGQTDVGASLDYQTDWMELIADRHKIGRNFNPEVGFLETNNRLSDFLDLNLKPRPKIRGVREIDFEGFLLHAPDTSGVLQTQEWQTTFRALFNNGAYTDDDIVDVFAQRITTPFNLYKNIFIPLGFYRWTRHQLTYGSAQDRRFTWSLFERFGSYYNGRLNEARVRGTYRRSDHLSFSVSEQWNRFRMPEGNFSVLFGVFETDYAFTRFLSLSSVLQMNTANTQGASANIRLRWNYRPDSDLFIIYTAGQSFASLAAVNPLQLYQHRLSVKLTYSFRP